MIASAKRLLDRWRGGGEHAVTVPPMDGALRPNEAIEEAPVLVEAAAPDNLATDGARLMFSSGASVLELVVRGARAATKPFATFDSPVSALALGPGGSVAAGLERGGIALRGGRHDGLVMEQIGGRALSCVTALRFEGEDTLVVALGSQRNGPDGWRYDLLQRNASGSVWRVTLPGGQATCLADGLAWPCGLAAAPDGGLVVAESWRNRLVGLAPGRRPAPLLTDIPGYPGRLSPRAEGAGHWLAVFAPRSQLVEFVLRERDYRESMMREVDPRFWIAPSLSAAQSFLEPMQVGGLKQLGVLKPWAPTRSYGLVIGLDAGHEPAVSFHSRASGQRHGVTSCVEFGGRLLATSKGGGVVVSLPLPQGGVR